MSKSAELKYRYNLPREVFDYLEKLENLEQQNKELYRACKSLAEFIKLNSWEAPSDISKLLSDMEERDE